MKEITFDDFKTIVSDHLGIDGKAIKNTSNFIEDFRIDSLSLVNFIIKLELKLGIKISNEKLMEMTDMGKAVKIINEALLKKAM
ncbi:MAG: acyl carrier protein [bacterium]